MSFRYGSSQYLQVFLTEANTIHELKTSFQIVNSIIIIHLYSTIAPLYFQQEKRQTLFLGKTKKSIDKTEASRYNNHALFEMPV